MPEQVDPVARALRARAVEDVDADMVVGLQRVGGGQHEHRAEQIPLQFEPGVRGHRECLAHDGVAGADQHRRQHQPGDEPADERRDPVDQPGQGQKTLHVHPPPSRGAGSLESRGPVPSFCRRGFGDRPPDGFRLPRRRRERRDTPSPTLCSPALGGGISATSFGPDDRRSVRHRPRRLCRRNGRRPPSSFILVATPLARTSVSRGRGRPIPTAL